MVGLRIGNETVDFAWSAQGIILIVGANCENFEAVEQSHSTCRVELDSITAQLRSAGMNYHPLTVVTNPALISQALVGEHFLQDDQQLRPEYTYLIFNTMQGFKIVPVFYVLSDRYELDSRFFNGANFPLTYNLDIVQANLIDDRAWVKIDNLGSAPAPTQATGSSASPAVVVAPVPALDPNSVNTVQNLIANFDSERPTIAGLTAQNERFLQKMLQYFELNVDTAPLQRIAHRRTEARALHAEIIAFGTQLTMVKGWFSDSHQIDTYAAIKALRIIEMHFPELVVVSQQLAGRSTIEKSKYYTEAATVHGVSSGTSGSFSIPYAQMKSSNDNRNSYAWYVMPNVNNRKLFVEVDQDGNFLPAKTAAELDSIFTAHIGNDKKSYVREVSDYFTLANHEQIPEVQNKIKREALNFINQSLLNPYSFCRIERWSTSAHKYTRSFLELLSFFRAEYANVPGFAEVIDPVVKQIAAEGKGGILTQSVLAQFSGTTYLPARNLDVTATNEGTVAARIKITPRSAL